MEPLSFLYYFIGIFPLFFASTNTQNSSFTHKRKCIVFIFIFFSTFFLFPFAKQTTTPIILVCVLIILIYNQEKKFIIIISFFLGYLLMVCLDYLITSVVSFYFQLTLQYMQSHYFLQFSLLYLPLTFALTKLLGWFLHKKLKIEIILSSSIQLLLICINLVISTAIFVISIVYGGKLGYPPNVIYFNMILFLSYFILSNIIFFIAYRTVQKDSQLKAQLEHYENLDSYTKEVERLYQNMRCFKHDYLDILSSMKGYIDKKDTEALSSYFYTTILPLNQQIADSDSRLGSLAFLKDEAVKSIVSAKLMIAIEKGLFVDIELREEIDIPSIAQVDLVRILGIFLNNATEAALESSEKELTVAFMTDKSKHTILIRNSASSLMVPIADICDQHVSGKAEHSGLGLYNARTILDSYENVRWKLDYTAPYFLVEITIISKTDSPKEDL